IVKAGGADFALALFEEGRSIAVASGQPPRPAFLEMAKGRLTDPGATVTASMLGDVERGTTTEADHILGDLIQRGKARGVEPALLGIAYTVLKAYDARKRRESAGD